MLDLLIIGSGPAGMTAALYSARAGLSVEVIEKSSFGGALTEISHLANFPGYNGGKGADLADILRSQVISAGGKISYGECESIKSSKNSLSISVDGESHLARSVLVATGSEPIPLDFTPSAPVSYCALCDAPLYCGKSVAVIGGGNSAVGESIHLSDIVSSLTLFSRSTLRADEVFVSELKKRKNVKILENYTPTADDLSDFDGIFVFIGKRPATSFLDSSLLDDDSYIKTENYMTSLPGLFAAGDVRSGSVKQAITAAADGAAASIAISAYLKSPQTSRH